MLLNKLTFKNFSGLPTVFIQLVIFLLRKFIYEEISECTVNKKKSGNRLYIYAPKVE